MAILAAALAGVVNALAGGGTLLTFPALLAVGLESKVANATSTVGLWPGAVGSAWGYRRDIARQSQGLGLFFLPSLLGGTVGALLLLWTKVEVFDVLVPFLILGATVLFVLQGIVQRWLRRRRAKEDHDAPDSPRWWLVIPLQFCVGVYGGYFGAGIGILMLAVLGILGLKDIHQMNGVKNLGGLCINGMAVLLFSISGLVDWPVAIAMAAASILGGYLGARLAKRVGPNLVRAAIVGVGLTSALWTAWPLFRS